MWCWDFVWLSSLQKSTELCFKRSFSEDYGWNSWKQHNLFATTFLWEMILKVSMLQWLHCWGCLSTISLRGGWSFYLGIGTGRYLLIWAPLSGYNWSTAQLSYFLNPESVSDWVPPPRQQQKLNSTVVRTMDKIREFNEELAKWYSRHTASANQISRALNFVRRLEIFFPYDGNPIIIKWDFKNSTKTVKRF